jgi:hypothetical protein
VAAAWSVAGHGAGAHAESGHQGRRDAVQRGAALVAAFLRSVAKAQPLSARGALRIQALNCSTRQGMHRSLLFAAATREKHRVNERDSAPWGLVSQEKYLLLVGVDIQAESKSKNLCLARKKSVSTRFDLIGKLGTCVGHRSGTQNVACI